VTGGFPGIWSAEPTPAADAVTIIFEIGEFGNTTRTA